MDSAPGRDEVSYKWVAEAGDKFRKALLHVYNAAWTKGMFPKLWKKALVQPVRKTGKPAEDPRSYRPISLLAVLGKIMEKMVQKRLEWFVEINKLIPNFQTGFRKGHSTTDNILVLEEAIRQAFKSGKTLVAVLVDFEGAFDHVQKRKLLEIMRSMDFPVTFISFIESFLSDRSFSVQVNHHTSSERKADMGLPQGSPLSPALFLILLSELDFSSPTTDKGAFADDLHIWETGSSPSESGKKLQKSLEELEAFSETFHLPISALKTKAAVFHRKRSFNPPSIKIYGQKVAYEKNPRLLGLTLDPLLNWTKQVEEVKQACMKRIVVLRRLKSFKWATPKILIEFYKKYIRSKMEFGIVAYGQCSENQLSKLETLQNMALRSALNLHKHSSGDRTRNMAGLPSVKERIAKLTLQYFSKVQAYGPDHIVHQRTFSRNPPQGCILSWDLFETKVPNWRLNTLSPSTFTETPPWTTRRLTVSLELMKGKKSTYSQPGIQAIFLEKANNDYGDHLHIYTDGSVKQGKAAAAAVIPKYSLKISQRLPDGASILSAELAAIFEALKVILIKPPTSKKVVIFSDSKSALLLIRNLHQKAADTDLTRLRSLLHKTELADTVIEFQHIPSHQGIKFNEEADRLASSTVETTTNLPAALTNLRDVMRKRISNLPHPSQPAITPIFREVDDNKLYFRIKSLALILRKEEFQYKLRPDPSCRFCSSHPETLQHIIFNCKSPAPQTAKIRRITSQLNLPEDIAIIVDIAIPIKQEREIYHHIITILQENNIS